MVPRRLLLCVAAMLAIGADIAAAREWSDNTGKFKTEAELVEVSGDTVQLKKANGVVISVPLARLSAADQAYLESLQGGAELTEASQEVDLPLATANNVGVIVIDPKPLLQHASVKQAPLSGLMEKAVGEAGIDFRKVDRVVVLIAKQETPTPGDMPVVATVEFSEAIDPATMLTKIPTTYETTTVAGKTCHKPADKKGPWVCVLDEKTLAFTDDENRFAAALAATSDDAELAALLASADAKNEFRYVLNMVPLKGQIEEAKRSLPPQAPPAAVKMMDAVAMMKAFTFTMDLDGPPSIEMLIEANDEASAGQLKEMIEEGLAQLPELAKMAAENAPQQGPDGNPMPMNPQMMAQMVSGMAQKMDEFLAIEPQGANVKVSVKFSPGTPPLVDSIAQMVTAFAMMAQQGGPFGGNN